MCKLNLSFSAERCVAKSDLMLLASVHYTLLKNIPIRLITSTVMIILLQPLFHDKKYLCVNLRLMSLKYKGEITLDLTEEKNGKKNGCSKDVEYSNWI